VGVTLLNSRAAEACPDPPLNPYVGSARLEQTVAWTPEMTARLLVVDDDADLRRDLRELCRASGFSVEFESACERGLARAGQGDYDLMILNSRMPGLDGMEALRRIRRSNRIPIIMLTPEAGRLERIRILDCGADGCLPKPLDPNELLAHARAVLRRSLGRRPGPGQALEAGRLTLFPASRDAFYRGRPLNLTAMECDILEQLLRSAGQVVSRDRLSARLYEREASPYGRSIDTHVSRIRRKLGAGRSLILSVRGTGYQLSIPAYAAA
jgi:DNA-binding response OmpR family regulator